MAFPCDRNGNFRPFNHLAIQQMASERICQSDAITDTQPPNHGTPQPNIASMRRPVRHFHGCLLALDLVGPPSSEARKRSDNVRVYQDGPRLSWPVATLPFAISHRARPIFPDQSFPSPATTRKMREELLGKHVSLKGERQISSEEPAAL
jgi:hypothetical protein